MSVIRWDPFRELLAMQNEMKRLFEGNLSDYGTRLSRSSACVPPVHVYETDRAYVLSVELPGVKKDQITLELKDKTLSLRGEKHVEKDETGEGFRRTDRKSGTFHRAFELPANVNSSEVKATYRDGLLEIILPKEEEPKPRQIKIAA